MREGWRDTDQPTSWRTKKRSETPAPDHVLTPCFVTCCLIYRSQIICPYAHVAQYKKNITKTFYRVFLWMFCGASAKWDCEGSLCVCAFCFYMWVSVWSNGSLCCWIKHQSVSSFFPLSWYYFKESCMQKTVRARLSILLLIYLIHESICLVSKRNKNNLARKTASIRLPQ